MIFLATEEIQDVVQSPEEVAKDVNQFVQWFEDQIPTLISFGIKVVLQLRQNNSRLQSYFSLSEER